MIEPDRNLAALSRRYSYPIILDHPDNRRYSQELVVAHEPFGDAAEAIRSIRTGVLSTALQHGLCSLLIVSPRKGAGATYLAANLAVAFAQMAIPTLLVDANLRRPRIGALFGIPADETGLSEVLIDMRRGFHPVKLDVIPNLSILTAGLVPPNPQELLASPEFVTLVNTAHENFGVVIYDTAPGMETADTLVIGSRIGAAIMVAKKHKSKFRDVAALSKKLSSVQCKLVGTVLNAF